jgi:maltooligosyltrehalose trehalohydrolase
MRQIDINRRMIGINFKSNGAAEVLVWAPKVEKLSIDLIEAGTSLPLHKQEYGYWSLETEDIKPGTHYKFLLNDEAAHPDPASLSQPGGVHNASEAIDLTSYKWQADDWNNIDLQDYIFYELHTGTFTSEGTFKALEQKLNYLKDLGVNAIEIMPVAQFPGERNWGYDGVFPFAVQNSYGGAKGLQHLVDTCHQKNIAVVLDVVYNHLGPEGNYMDLYGHYFTDKYHTPWGNAVNFDDAWSDAVRQYFIENVLMWFRDFRIDALRMDAVHAIKDFSPVHILKEIREHVDRLMQETGRRHYLIVEMDLNDTRFINPISKGGFGMDAQWIDEFHHALRVTAGEASTGYYSDFNGLKHLAKSYKDAYVYDGQYSPHRKKTFGVKAEDNPGEQFVVFSQNHDQVGNRMLGERTSQLVSFEMQKLLAGAVICSPFLPMLFMGEEYAETNPFLYFVSHTGKELAEAVSKGRKKEFADFHIEGEAPDPNDEQTFLHSKLQWDLLQKEPHRNMFSYYQRLLALRKKEPALHHLSRTELEVAANEENKTLALYRWHDNDYVVCLMNFSKKTQEFVMPAEGSEWNKLLGSADIQWGGVDSTKDCVNGGEKISLPAESLLIYKRGEEKPVPGA